MNFSDFPNTQLEASRFFSNPENCHDFLVAIRWSDGVHCPHCESDKVGKLVVSGNRRLWNCKNCKKQFTAKVKTIFEDSPLGLDKWLPAVWMLVNAKNGISSCELARALGVAQKTAWHMGHRIRAAMHTGSFTLSGNVEADETFIGGKARFMHKGKRTAKGRGPSAMIPVMGTLERTTEEKASKVTLSILGTNSRVEVQSHVRKTVTKGSVVFTDALKSYQGLGGEYVHSVVDHAECYVRDNVHTNGLENFWSLLKRTLKGTYVTVAPFHLFRYLDEQSTRFNERKDNDLERFLGTLSRISGRRLTYKKLTGKDSDMALEPLTE